MTPQQIFDTVATHLFTQGKPARDEDGSLYRGPYNTKCAVGCLIPDDKYFPVMEDKTVGMVLRLFGALNFLRPHECLLSELQSAHDDPDNWDTTEAMRATLQDVADAFGLTLNPELRFNDR